jgi:tRNA U34 2-thiouridine synthase MnmA/TrmU
MPGGPATSWGFPTTCGTSRSASRKTWSRTSSTSTPPAALPNPCMRCNERIKFAALLEKAIALGFDAVCTGHYAKVIEDADGNSELHRAADWAKDQSYVLGVLTHEQLKHSMFPLADTPSKAEVRAEAERRGLSVANKPDSHDICFILTATPPVGWPKRST